MRSAALTKITAVKSRCHMHVLCQALVQFSFSFVYVNLQVEFLDTCTPQAAMLNHAYWQQQHFELTMTMTWEQSEIEKQGGQVDIRCNIHTSSSVRVDLRCQHLSEKKGKRSSSMSTVLVAWGAEQNYYFTRRGGALDVKVCFLDKLLFLMWAIECEDSFYFDRLVKSLDSNACRPSLQLRSWAGKRGGWNGGSNTTST